MSRLEVTRRRFFTLIVGLNCLLHGRTQAAETSGQLKRSPLDDLNLSAQELGDLEKFAKPVLMAARSLDELDLGNLPLDAFSPGFTFAPEQFCCAEASTLGTAS